MQYEGYLVDPSFIRGSSIIWYETGNGEVIVGTKGGKKYFIKRNIHLRKFKEKTSDMSDAFFEKNNERSNLFEKKQSMLKEKMKGLSLEKNHICVELDHLWDKENMISTVTDFVGNLLDKHFDYTMLNNDQFLDLSKKIVKLFVDLHACGVTHGDVKEGNIPVSYFEGEYWPYLVDFDSSSFDNDEEFECVAGTEGYESPEIILRGISEEKEDGKIVAITEKTDIFSLAVMLHKMWVGRNISFEGKAKNLACALLNDCKPVIDNKFNFELGTKNRNTFSSVLKWMISTKAEDRPTAQQLSDALNDEIPVPESCVVIDESKYNCTLWDNHSYLTLIPVSEMIEKGVAEFYPVNNGSGSSGYKYHVVFKDGSSDELSAKQLYELEYATIDVSKNFDTPWPEDKITFADYAEFLKAGYCKIKQTVCYYQKRYILTTFDGRDIDKGANKLIEEKLAKQIVNEVKADTPWSEHGTEYVIENMQKLGVKEIMRVDVSGEHRYKIIYHEMVDGKNKEVNNVPAKNLLLMRFIR